MAEGNIWLRETYVDGFRPRDICTGFGPRNVVPTGNLIPLVSTLYTICFMKVLWHARVFGNLLHIML